MKICLIAEGSYPYVTGGVSSWMQMLIRNMSEHEFIVYAIAAEKKAKGKFQYTPPENVIEVKEVFLDQFLGEKPVYGRGYKMEEDQKEAFIALLMGNNPNWKALFSFIREEHTGSMADFFMSRVFFDILQEAYEVKYSQIPFTEFFWTLRSMLLPLFYIVRQDFPRAQIYHSVSTGYAGIMGCLGKYLYDSPFILTEHGIYTREREEEIIKSSWVKGYFKDLWIEFFYSLSRCSYDAADEVITLFQKNKEIQMELGCEEDKIQIIPNGVDLHSFEDLAAKENEDVCMNIGALVRIVPIKDIKTMLQSFRIVKEEIKNARFYIMGPMEEDIEYFEECRQMVEQLQLQDVIFTGRVDIRQYIGKMDVLVLSSISEGQPLAILEGMACKKPYVATDVGSCRELLEGAGDGFGRAGIVVPVMHYEKMARAIIVLCRNEKKRVELGENAFHRVFSMYTIERFIEGYKDIYQRYEEG